MRTNSFLTVFSLFFSLSALADPKVIYELPATQTSEAAHYTLTQSGLTQDANHVRTLTFKLPDDLVGKSSEVIALTEVSSSEAFSYFTDGKVSAACATTTLGLNCVLSYPVSYLSTIDAESVNEVLAAKWGNDPEGLKAAKNRAARFRSEPQGSIQILF